MSPSTISALVLALAILGAGAATATAGGGDDDADRFASLVEKGGELFRAEKWAEARAKWEEAYQLNPNPTLLFNIASTYRREGDNPKALEFYKKYLEVAPADARFRPVAAEAIVSVQQALDAKNNAEKPPAEVHRSSGGGGGGTVLRWTGVSLAAVGAVSLGFGIFQGLEARDLNDRLEALPENTEWTRDLQDDYDRGESLERQAIIFSVIGGVAVAVGGGLFVTGLLDHGSEEERPVAVAPLVGRGRAGLAVAGSF